MRNRFVILIVALVALLIFSLVIVAQNRGGRGGQAAAPDNRPFNAKDLAGIWSRNSNGYGGGGSCRACGDRGVGNSDPPLTPPCPKIVDSNKHTHRHALGRERAQAHPPRHLRQSGAGP